MADQGIYGELEKYLSPFTRCALDEMRVALKDKSPVDKFEEGRLYSEDPNKIERHFIGTNEVGERYRYTVRTPIPPGDKDFNLKQSPETHSESVIAERIVRNDQETGSLHQIIVNNMSHGKIMTSAEYSFFASERMRRDGKTFQTTYGTYAFGDNKQTLPEDFDKKTVPVYSSGFAPRAGFGIPVSEEEVPEVVKKLNRRLHGCLSQI